MAEISAGERMKDRAQWNEYVKAYRSRPENHAKYLAYQREYSQRPEVKARRRERDQGVSRRMILLRRMYKKHGLTHSQHDNQNLG